MNYLKSAFVIKHPLSILVLKKVADKLASVHFDHNDIFVKPGLNEEADDSLLYTILTHRVTVKQKAANSIPPSQLVILLLWWGFLTSDNKNISKDCTLSNLVG